MTRNGPARSVRELLAGGDVPRYLNPEWAEAFPWLAQGITARGEGPVPFDLALFGSGPAGEVLGRWAALGAATGLERWVHGRQVHGDTVRLHEGLGPGLHLAPACDGHVSAEAGVLLTVGLADCVAVSLVEPRRRAVALLHAGWRGTAAGILERGLEVLWERLAVPSPGLHAHLGPAICGGCYQVGPEVHEALGLGRPAVPAPVDLRTLLASRARSAGIAAERITVSAHCTRCGDSPFFSHRAGSAGRQIAFLGIAGQVGPGLCGLCEHARVVKSRRGSRFHLCELSRVDARFPRYPPLPVLSCAGFRAAAPVRAEDQGHSAEGETEEPGDPGAERR